MTDETTKDETQDDAAPEAEAETTDAPEGVADAENLPVEQVPEGDVPGSAEQEAAEPEASAEALEPESTQEPAEGPPAEETGEPTEESAEQPAGEVESTEEPAEGSEEATAEDAATTVGPKPKKKRLPRALRPTRSKPRRERPAERKTITRLPKPEHDRGRRQERQGTVVSAGADKTIVVRVDVVKVHPMYKKVVKRSTKLHAHDEQNEAKVGDVVRLVETRPLSKLKRWRLQEVVEAAK
jgi:small subunit ribosomal protein S17